MARMMLVPLSLFALVAPALGATYNMVESYVGEEFLSAFTAQAITDPTNGRVNYLDTATATSLGLLSSTANTFTLKADSTTTLTPSGPGRNSVRLQSNKQYTKNVLVFDINHMPTGCGTWPAIWSFDAALVWPAGGEIDIVEGVNDIGPNQATLHTTPDCTIPATGDETGTVVTTNCDANVAGNPGCGVRDTRAESFGPEFNANGGGWYAMEWTSDFIKVWFWPRNAADVPDGVKSGSQTVITENWGTPMAFFPSTTCDIDSHFSAQNIIINLTFCGDWAGQDAIYSGAGCPSTCVDFVNNNPSAFTDAYFEFASLNIYSL